MFILTNNIELSYASGLQLWLWRIIILCFINMHWGCQCYICFNCLIFMLMSFWCVLALLCLSRWPPVLRLFLLPMCDHLVPYILSPPYHMCSDWRTSGVTFGPLGCSAFAVMQLAACHRVSSTILRMWGSHWSARQRRHFHLMWCTSGRGALIQGHHMFTTDHISGPDSTQALH